MAARIAPLEPPYEPSTGELLDAGLVEQDDEQRYQLTKLGVELRAALEPLLRWSDRWAAARRRP